MSSAVSLEHLAFHHPPIVTAGELTLKILMEFKQSCHDFFSHAKGGVANDMKVACIFPSFQDQLV